MELARASFSVLVDLIVGLSRRGSVVIGTDFHSPSETPAAATAAADGYEPRGSGGGGFLGGESTGFYSNTGSF